MPRLILSPDAVVELDDIWEFVALNSEKAADQVIDEIAQRFELLLTMPEAGRSRSDLEPELRSFPIGRYVIFYRLTGDILEIVRVLHGARDIESFSDEKFGLRKEKGLKIPSNGYTEKGLPLSLHLSGPAPPRA